MWVSAGKKMCPWPWGYMIVPEEQSSPPLGGLVLVYAHVLA
jgi:hypothetical protein